MTCKECHFYGDSGSGDPGYCHWGKTLPPVLKELLSALEAEPGNRIAYSVFKGMEVSVDEGHSCSCFTPTEG